MKRTVEFNTHFTIPKKKKNDGTSETDVYTEAIGNDSYTGIQAPDGYGIANTVVTGMVPDYTAYPGYNPAVTGPPFPFNTAVLADPAETMQFATNQYPFMTAGYSASTVKEVPKVGNPYRSTATYLNDPSLPKVLAEQFQPLFCKLCESRLSSNAMAKLHYESKKHNKKVRQFLIEYAEETGEPLHPKAILLASKGKTEEDKDPRYYHCTECDLPLTGRMHAESHYMGRNHRRVLAGNDPVGRGHYDVTGKWVREIALKIPTLTDNFGLDFITPAIAAAAAAIPFPKKKDLNVEELHCGLCNVAVTSDEQMALHLTGQKHKKREALYAAGQLTQTFGGTDDYTDMSAFRTPTGGYYCEPCNATMNSEIPFRQHLASKKHKRGPSRVPYTAIQPVPKVKLEEKSFSCNVCNVSMTSEMQLSLHINGHKHKKVCEEKGISVNGSSNDNQQYYKYRTPSGLYYCKRCDLTLNTEAQFKSHITGKKHWGKIAQGTTPSTSK